ncbi:MAG: hypothetical protein ACPGVO_01455 [Spirulinaceae cyanobacterium]
MKIRFNSVILVGAIVSALMIIGSVSQSAQAEVVETEVTAFDTEISNNCGSHGNHVRHSKRKQ